MAAPDDAPSLVQQALRAELNGQKAQRGELLEAALTADPACAAARWHSGQVLCDFGKAGEQAWLPVREAEALAAADPVLADYVRIRDRKGDDAEGNEAVARWCQSRGLQDRAKIHWARVLQLQPTHKAARDRLHLQECQGRLFTREQITEFKQERVRFNQLRRQWLPTLVSWRRAFLGRDAAARDSARGQLQKVAEPSLIGLLETELSPHDEQLARDVVDVLGGIPDQAATESLVRHAVLASWPSVRSAAAQQLKPRPPHGYVPLLIDALHAPWEFVSWVDESKHRVEYVVKREMRHADHLLHGTVGLAVVPVGSRRPVSRSSLARAAERAERDLADDVEDALQRRVDRWNAKAEEFDEPIYEALRATTGQDLGAEPLAWDRWWNDYNEYYVPSYHPVVTSRRYDRAVAAYKVLSCFPTGTPVWTQTGRRPIELIRPGDMVLSQDPQSGELAYRPVLATTLRPPAEILEVQAAGDVLQTTKGHPLWLDGHGWQLAKFLAAGDRLHTVHGAALVDVVRPLPRRQPAHNLVVSEFHTYFVGDAGLLVHDNTPVVPPGVALPGLRPAAD